MSYSMIRSILIAGVMLSAPVASYAEEPSYENEQFQAQASDNELSESRGAFLPMSLNLENVQQEAQDSHNVVIGGFTGSNAVSGSFNNSSGLINVIQNSGNNVIIQSSTTVNMTFNK